MQLELVRVRKDWGHSLFPALVDALVDE